MKDQCRRKNEEWRNGAQGAVREAKGMAALAYTSAAGLVTVARAGASTAGRSRQSSGNRGPSSFVKLCKAINTGVLPANIEKPRRDEARTGALHDAGALVGRPWRADAWVQARVLRLVRCAGHSRAPGYAKPWESRLVRLRQALSDEKVLKSISVVPSNFARPWCYEARLCPPYVSRRIGLFLQRPVKYQEKPVGALKKNQAQWFWRMANRTKPSFAGGRLLRSRKSSLQAKAVSPLPLCHRSPKSQRVCVGPSEKVKTAKQSQIENVIIALFYRC